MKTEEMYEETMIWTICAEATERSMMPYNPQTEGGILLATTSTTPCPI
jgi:hypothetical protein